MRHSSRPAIPPPPQPYRTQIVDHLGLVAGMCAARGITEVLDTATQPNPARRLVPAGHAGTAMVLNGLGFLNPPLALVPHFFPPTPRARLMAATAATRLGLTPTCRHRETTRCHVEGRSHSAEAPDAPVVPLPHGSRREHRPALPHVLVELVGEHYAGLPVLLPLLRSPRSDGHAFGQVVRDHLAPLPTTTRPPSLGAASAL